MVHDKVIVTLSGEEKNLLNSFYFEEKAGLLTDSESDTRVWDQT